MFSSDASEFATLARQLTVAATRIGAPVSAALRKSSKAMEADARALAPVGATGDLADSIEATTHGDGRSASMSAEVSTDVPYAGYVEYGTSRQAPQPFMQPAVEKHLPPLESAFERALEDLL